MPKAGPEDNHLLGLQEFHIFLFFHPYIVVFDFISKTDMDFKNYIFLEHNELKKIQENSLLNSPKSLFHPTA